MPGIGIGRFAKGRPTQATQGSSSSSKAKADPPSVPGTITLQTNTNTAAAATPTANPSRQESGWSNASTNEGFQQGDDFCFADDGGNFFDHESEASSNHFMNDNMSFDNASFGGGGNGNSAFEDDVMPPSSYHKMHHGHGPSAAMAANSPLRADKPKMVFGFSRFASKKNKTPTDASKCNSEQATKNHTTAVTPNPGEKGAAPAKTTGTPGLQDTGTSNGTNAENAPGENTARPPPPAPMATPSPASTANPPPMAMDSDMDTTPPNLVNNNDDAREDSRRISFEGSPGTNSILLGYPNNDAGTNPRRVSNASATTKANENKSPPFQQEEKQEEQEQLRRRAQFANNITDNRRMRTKAAAITPNPSVATTRELARKDTAAENQAGSRPVAFSNRILPRANPNPTANPMTDAVGTAESPATERIHHGIPARAVDGMELSFESNQAGFLTTIRETADLQGKIDQDLMDANERFSEYYSLLLRDLETAVDLLDKLEDIETLADETMDLYQQKDPPGSCPEDGDEEDVRVDVAQRDSELERGGSEPASNP